MLLSQIIATMISIVKFERNNFPYTIEDILKGEFSWNMYEITSPCYVMNICMLYRLYFKQNDLPKEELIGYTHANFHHATTFEISRFKFDDYRASRTGASNLTLFGAVYINCS